MTKVKSKIKYYSFILAPSVIVIIVIILNKIFGCLNNVDEDKIDILVSISATFIAVLFTVLTIYVAVPVRKEVSRRMIETKHQHIYVTNVFMGIIAFLLAILIWLFLDISFLVILLFIFGATNTLIAGYYTVNLITR